MAEQYKHLFIRENVVKDNYKASPSRRPQANIPGRDRASHSSKLLQQFAEIWRRKEETKASRTAESISTREGTYLSFTSAINADLITKSLENIKKGIRLLNIKEEIVEENHKQIKATVYIPNGLEGFFISKIVKYQTEYFGNTDKPKNAPLVNSIEDVSIALLESLWTDKTALIPEATAKWCEAWLSVNANLGLAKAQLQSFINTLAEINIEHKTNYIHFPERAVILVNANKAQLVELMLRSDLLAEFRAGQEAAGFWMNETAIEQQAWVDDLLQRLKVEENTHVKICILDTGVNNAHQLLRPILADSDTLTVNPAWGTNDHETKAGHGTLMAGLAGYGNLQKILTSGNSVLIKHHLCSVKILPPPNQEQTPRELWGAITEQGIARAEIQNPDKVLLYCMSITSIDDMDKGRPSSWSGAVDKLAYGEEDNKRLIIISAGNINDYDLWKDYPASNFVSSIQNPAQSWNALTIGAYTGKNIVNDVRYNLHKPVANENELSPYSTTSLIWEKKWPIKPDVVFEGGNLLNAPDGSITSHDDFNLLSTSKSFNLKPFDTINATSAAAAQASWFTAQIAYLYPEAWAETIRGLVVHSSSWMPAMLIQMNVRKGNKGDFKNLMKVFGYGIPDIETSLYSSESALTYIVQETIQPFNFKEKDGRKTTDVETNEIHIYNLPWPKDVLLGMGNISVKLKITLSYFIEPGAGEIGWKDKYRYQSFGLRFDVNSVGETLDFFKKRINVAARTADDEPVNGNSGSDRWIIGNNNRSNGSIHSDIWEGTAAELATCNSIGVFPVIGWWRERKHLNKVEENTRYSLIVSLITPAEDVQLYTTVKNIITAPIEIIT